MKAGEYCDIADDLICGRDFKCASFVRIEKDVVIGDNVTVESFVVVRSGARIGDNVALEEHAVVLSGGVIGSGTKIGTYTKVGKKAVIGENCKFTAFCEVRDNCKLGDNVAMGSRGTLSAGTVVENDVIMKYAFVVTDTPVVGQEQIKSVGTLKKGSRFGANVTIMPGVTVGENSEIGACSQVRYDVPDNEVWYGNPAKFFKKIKD
jgi:UDP-2-acetamido-3-amino-2,3-dideoxy-glucuronate N-acetyltransferase